MGKGARGNQPVLPASSVELSAVLFPDSSKHNRTLTSEKLSRSHE